jgi:hypothetical protein
MGLQNTMAVRLTSEKPYEFNLAKSTMTIKSVTAFLGGGNFEPYLFRCQQVFPVFPRWCRCHILKDYGTWPRAVSVEAFGTSDTKACVVVILGWRLALIANNLRDNQLASVRALPQRFAQLEGNRPFVASITIAPVARGKARFWPNFG